MEGRDNQALQDASSLPIETIKGVKFTPREIDILACILGGRTAKKIASFLCISSKTVETHISHIMLKLECNSRMSISDFLESSDEIFWLKNHYADLSFQALLEKKLKEISQQVKEPLSCSLVYGVEDKGFTFLIPQLEKHLKITGAKITVDPRKESWTVSTLMEEIENSSSEPRLFAIPQNLKEAFQTTKSDLLFLLLANKKKTLINFSELFPHQRNTQKNYYFSLVEILKCLFPKYNFDDLLSQIEKHYKNNTENISQTKLGEIANNKNYIFNNIVYQNLNNKIWQISLVSLIVMVVFFYYGFELIFQPKDALKQQESSVHSDLLIPHNNVLLDRPEILTEIDEKLKGQDGIQTIALVGIGGAGKTTTARQYAHQQKTNVIWEINAETQESLKASFENLAQGISNTEEDQKILRELLDIKNPEEKEKKILSFVKEGLRLYSHWFLIYDNVESFSDIQDYFPQDNNSWGQGKIILTTRNTNIHNNSQISHVILVGELTQKQKLDLFTKIMSRGALRPFTAAQNAEAPTFLENIPPFPLDVSVAAYYLKSTNISYERYLENLKNYNNEFSRIQKNLLKEAGTYLKTRYSIITLSLEHLIKSHKDFGELLLFISLLDSQNIPRGLLNKHKGDAVVDNFIYHLKKYSLITNNFSDSISDSIFSIHRSTQIITLAYLTKELNLLKNNKTLQEICNTFIKYTVDTIEKGNFLKQKYLLNHCIVFLSHKNILTDFMKASISGELGGLYCHQGFYEKAKKTLETTLQTMDKRYPIFTCSCFNIFG